jgi:mono/diheme cytochrome c family protein
MRPFFNVPVETFSSLMHWGTVICRSRTMTLRSIVAIYAASIACAGMAFAQSPVERGAYLVNTIMTCQNCHTPKGPQGDIADKTLAGGVRFDEKPFDVTASNITPDKATGIGNWSDADIRNALQDGRRPNNVQLAAVMPSGFYKILIPGDLDAIVAYLRTVKPVTNKVPDPVYKMNLPLQVFPGSEKPFTAADLNDKVKRGFYLAQLAIAWNVIRRSATRASITQTPWARAGVNFRGRGAYPHRPTSPRTTPWASAPGATRISSARSGRASARMAAN